MTKKERIKIKKTVKILSYVIVSLSLVGLSLFTTMVITHSNNKYGIIAVLICLFTAYVLDVNKTGYSREISRYITKIRLDKFYFYCDKFEHMLKEEKTEDGIAFFFEYIRPKKDKYPIFYHFALGYALAKIEGTQYYEIFKSRMNESE